MNNRSLSSIQTSLPINSSFLKRLSKKGNSQYGLHFYFLGANKHMIQNHMPLQSLRASQESMNSKKSVVKKHKMWVCFVWRLMERLKLHPHMLNRMLTHQTRLLTHSQSHDSYMSHDIYGLNVDSVQVTFRGNIVKSDVIVLIQ